MAAGNTLATWRPPSNQPPASAYATLSQLNSHLLLDFDPTTPESAVFGGVWPEHYSGNGVSVHIWFLSSATSGDVRWGVSFENLAPDDHAALSSDEFASEVTGDVAVDGTANKLKEKVITLTDGAQINALAIGDPFRVKIRRVADASQDTVNAADVRLYAVEIKET